ncbi:MAG: hypothetical protein RLZZ426_1097 [Actinomycetota bacterium]|jgi:rhodanese-related sulfurtransferase
MRISRIAGVALAAIALVLVGCSSESADTSPNNKTISVVVDVRTAGEFAAGHVAGSLNIDAEASSFDTNIAQLDPNETYLVYCQSGRRSAIAAQKMTDAGLTVLDGGGIDAMLGNGWSLGL